MMTATSREFKYFTGVDVGKFTLVIHDSLTRQTQEIANTRRAIRGFFEERSPADTLVICETTGGYEAELLAVCTELGIAIHRANTFQVKAFIRSLGVHGKTDAIDAQALTRYGQERYARLSLWSAPAAEEKRLKKLAQRRRDLIQMMTQEKNRLQAPDEDADARKTIQALLRTLQTQLARIDAVITEIIQSHTDLQRKQTIMTQIAGVGTKTAQALLATMPELGQLTRRQTACLAGLAPHPHDSGTHSGRRIIRGGRREVRCALYMAALSAARHHSELKTFYGRLIANGKRPIVAITAVMRKLLTIINAKIRDALYANLMASEQS